jgi:hypothetical protein
MKNVVFWDVTPCDFYKERHKKTPWPLGRERTIPTELPPIVDEIVNFCG